MLAVIVTGLGWRIWAWVMDIAITATTHNDRRFIEEQLKDEGNYIKGD
jgi:hypothetical protein